LFSVKMLRGRAKLYPTPYWEKTYWEGITYLLLFLYWVGTMAKYIYAWFRGMSARLWVKPVAVEPGF
jgi:hypothetical protein